jgi:asparagine synthetase A
LGTSSDLLQLITSALNLGVLGVVFWLFVGGKLHASSELDRVTADKDEWRKAYEEERSGHRATREALVIANERAEAAVESARVTNKLLEAVQQQQLRKGS